MIVYVCYYSDYEDQSINAVFDSQVKADIYCKIHSLEWVSFELNGDKIEYGPDYYMLNKIEAEPERKGFYRVVARYEDCKLVSVDWVELINTKNVNLGEVKTIWRFMVNQFECVVNVYGDRFTAKETGMKLIEKAVDYDFMKEHSK